jgi:hypothetical protein
MNSFVPPKRKLWELVILLVLIVILYFINPNIDFIVLFVCGFIWNWVASNDLSTLFTNRRYRMSSVRMVYNLQRLMLRPFDRAPHFVKVILSILPAGIFWSIVILLNQSDLPWWSTFLGSMSFELLQLELNFINNHKEGQ